MIDEGVRVLMHSAAVIQGRQDATPPAAARSGTGVDGGPLPHTRNFRAILGQSAAVSVGSQLTAPTAVLPFVCIANGGSPIAAFLIFPVYSLAVVIGNLSAPAAVSRIHSRTPVLLAAAAAATAAVTGIAALGSLIGAAGEFVFLGAAVALGLLSGAASVLTLEVSTTALRTRDLGWVSALQGAAAGVLVLAITAANLVLMPRPDSVSAHVALIWLGALSFAAAAPFCLRIVCPPRHRAEARITLKHALLAGGRHYRADPGLRVLMLVQICFLTVTLGMTFFTAHGAAMHGSASDSLHTVVMYTAAGLVAYAVLWPLIRKWVTLRGLHVAAALIVVGAGVLSIRTDVAQLGPDNPAFGLIFALATFAARMLSTARQMWLERAVRHDRAIVIGFNQLVVGTASLVLAFGLGLLGHVHGLIWPVAVVVGLTVAALGTVRWIPTLGTLAA